MRVVEKRDYLSRFLSYVFFISSVVQQGPFNSCLHSAVIRGKTSRFFNKTTQVGNHVWNRKRCLIVGGPMFRLYGLSPWIPSVGIKLHVHYFPLFLTALFSISPSLRVDWNFIIGITFFTTERMSNNASHHTLVYSTYWLTGLTQAEQRRRGGISEFCHHLFARAVRTAGLDDCRG